MKFELKGLGIVSVTKISTAFGVIAGLIYGIFFAALPNPAMPTQTGNMMMDIVFKTFFGKMAIISLPVIYAIVGAISGAIYSGLYNFLVKHMGGIEIELIPMTEKQGEGSETPPGEDTE
jgi:hypothetical protein